MEFPTLIFAALLVAGCVQAEAGSSKPVCEEDEHQLDDFSICIYNTNYTTWARAYQICLDRGMDLASVHSFEENEAILRWGSFAPRWIGLNDIQTEGEFVWTDGTPVDYNGWHIGPDGGDLKNCVAMHGGDGFWMDSTCSGTLMGACLGPLLENRRSKLSSEQTTE